MPVRASLTTTVSIVGALVVGVRGQSVAQTQPNPPDFRTGVDLVALNVAVQDRQSAYVKGLTQSDFVVYQDNVKQNVRFFEGSTLPFDLIVLLDASGSMGDKMDLAQSAARGFFDTLRPDDRGAVVAFNEHAHVLSPLTQDRAALLNAIASVHADGRTALNSALYISLRQFGLTTRSRGVVRRQAIAVLSDGKDNASLVSFDDVIEVARQTGVNVYTVRLQSSSELEEQVQATGQAKYYTSSDYDMRTLARETGGLSFFPLAERLPEIYCRIAEDLGHQYSIGYEPVDATADGGFHRVRVEILNHPEMHVLTRVGYSAVQPRGTR